MARKGRALQLPATTVRSTRLYELISYFSILLIIVGIINCVNINTYYNQNEADIGQKYIKEGGMYIPQQLFWRSPRIYLNEKKADERYETKINGKIFNAANK